MIGAETPEHWKGARHLLERYAASLDFDLDFQDFVHELDALPGDYGPPNGGFLLAQQNDRFVGCVALRKCSDRTCEMKRLYVAPDQRNQGIGRSLVEAIITAAGSLGYELCCSTPCRRWKPPEGFTRRWASHRPTLTDIIQSQGPPSWSYAFGEQINRYSSTPGTLFARRCPSLCSA